MKKIMLLIIIILALTGCESAVLEESVEDIPPEVKIVNLSYDDYDFDGYTYTQRYIIHLKNVGGDGKYKIQFWDHNGEINGQNYLQSESEVYTIEKGQEYTGTWTHTGDKARIVKILCRKEGDPEYIETDIYEFW